MHYLFLLKNYRLIAQHKNQWVYPFAIEPRISAFSIYPMSAQTHIDNSNKTSHKRQSWTKLSCTLAWCGSINWDGSCCAVVAYTGTSLAVRGGLTAEVSRLTTAATRGLAVGVGMQLWSSERCVVVADRQSMPRQPWDLILFKYYLCSP